MSGVLTLLKLCDSKWKFRNSSMSNLRYNLYGRVIRNLQLRIEEQGRYLQMMLEKQCKPSIPVATTVEGPLTTASDLMQSTDKVDVPENSHDSANTKEGSKQVGNKEKMPDAELSDKKESDAIGHY
ncbi:hypothetical protein BHM03_00056015 [Ensete ventricosum]|nr:hypothetical protein BHM03_00056015 [Ensete ventricosum]